MSHPPLPASESAIEDWQLSDDKQARPASLIVELRREAYVFPYFRFFSAEGDNARIRIVFASHAITASGHGLAQLLSAFAAQRVVRLVQPSENEARFGVRGPNGSTNRPRITDITIEELK